MKDSQRGFTLIELSIVMMLLGIATVAAIQAYRIYDEKRKFETTELRLSAVEQAINDFVMTNGRLPCAAPRGVDRTVSAYGREENCQSAASGTVSVVGKDTKRVRIGMLPARTLGIADSYMQDAYNNSLVYAVTEDLTDEAKYAHDGGGIDVLDNTGASRLSAVGFAQYILVSPGNAGYGAYSYSGQESVPCDDARLEGENCNDDAIFVDTDLSRGDIAGFYDDRTVYKHRLPVVLESEAPPSCEQTTGAFIIAGNCPDGWDRVTTMRNSTFPSHAVPEGSYANAPQYYNEDEDGNYYFSGVSTPDTVNLGSSPAGTHSGTTPGIYCDKQDSNTATTKCFTETVSTTGVSGMVSDTGCPEDFTTLDVKNNNYSYEQGGSYEHASYKVYNCVK